MAALVRQDHEVKSNDVYHFHDVSADSVLQAIDSLAWFKLEMEIDNSIDGFESEITSQLSSLTTKVKVTWGLMLMKEKTIVKVMTESSGVRPGGDLFLPMITASQSVCVSVCVRTQHCLHTVANLVSLSVYLSVCLSACLSVWVFVCLSVRLYVG